VQPLAAFLAIGQILHQQPAAHAMPARIRHAQPDQRGQLLGLHEIALAGFGQALALQRHNALIALAGYRQIEGDGQITRQTVLQRGLAGVRAGAFGQPSASWRT
jgi:hypothetical protein